MNISKLSKIFNKNTILNILVITIISGLLGFIYNILQPNPLPLVYTPKHIDKIDDSILFNTNEPQKIENNLQPLQEKRTDTITIKDDNISKNEIPEKEIKETPDQSKNINPKELKSVNLVQMKRIVGNQDFVIIDARRPEDYNKSHIPGAINLFALADPNEKFEIIMTIPVGKKYVIYCDGGNCDLSHQLANEFLTSFGFTNVFVYEGGWEEWNKNN